MNLSVFSFSLDVKDTVSRIVIPIKQADTGRKLQISLADGHKPYEITSECLATLRAVKPDGTVLFNACTVQGNQIETEITAQMVAAVGVFPCEVTLYGADGRQLISPKFTLNVLEKIGSDEEIESTNEYSALTKTMSEAAALIDDVQAKLESGEFKGEKGEKGDPGDIGPAGSVGPQGPRGERGEKGDTGAQGPQGERGDTGAQGPKGDKGETGEKGDPGEKGADGTVTFDELTDAQKESLKGEKGEKGDTGETGAVGPQGPQGEKGETGATGLQGPEGPQGPQGEKGEKGDPGSIEDLPAATDSVLGCVKVGRFLEASEDGTLNVVPSCTTGGETLTETFHVDSSDIGSGSSKIFYLSQKVASIVSWSMTDDGDCFNGASLLVSEDGGVYFDNYLDDYNGDGNDISITYLSAPETADLVPFASKESAGVVKVGEFLEISKDGTLSVTTSCDYEAGTITERTEMPLEIDYGDYQGVHFEPKYPIDTIESVTCVYTGTDEAFSYDPTYELQADGTLYIVVGAWGEYADAIVTYTYAAGTKYLVSEGDSSGGTEDSTQASIFPSYPFGSDLTDILLNVRTAIVEMEGGYLSDGKGEYEDITHGLLLGVGNGLSTARFDFYGNGSTGKYIVYTDNDSSGLGISTNITSIDGLFHITYVKVENEGEIGLSSHAEGEIKYFALTPLNGATVT